MLAEQHVGLVPFVGSFSPAKFVILDRAVVVDVPESPRHVSLLETVVFIHSFLLQVPSYYDQGASRTLAPRLSSPDEVTASLHAIELKMAQKRQRKHGMA